jgi:hypothetical protein
MGVEASSHLTERILSGFESVRCLACGSDYSKPVGGGTAAANPGCPVCGYLGWQPVTVRREWPRLRSAEGPPQRRTA